MIKIIWSFWDTHNKPDLVRASINSWKINAPNWNIIILSNENIYDYLDKSELPRNFDTIEKTNSIQFKSDLIRLLLLYKYGGLWLDASLFLLTDINWLEEHIISNNITEFTGFIKNNPFMENWFIYVHHKQNKHIKKIYDILVDICNYNKVTDHYIYKIDSCTTNKTYFMMYQTYCYLLKTDSDFKNAHNNASLIKLYQGGDGWNALKFGKVISKIDYLLELYLNNDTIIEPFLYNDKIYKVIGNARSIYKYKKLIISSIILLIIILSILIVYIIYKLLNSKNRH